MPWKSRGILTVTVLAAAFALGAAFLLLLAITAGCDQDGGNTYSTSSQLGHFCTGGDGRLLFWVLLPLPMALLAIGGAVGVEQAAWRFLGVGVAAAVCVLAGSTTWLARLDRHCSAADVRRSRQVVPVAGVDHARPHCEADTSPP